MARTIRRTRDARAPKSAPTTPAPASARAPKTVTHATHVRPRARTADPHDPARATMALIDELDAQYVPMDELANLLGRSRDIAVLRRLEQLSKLRCTTKSAIHPDALVLRVCDVLTRIAESLERIDDHLEELGGRL